MKVGRLTMQSCTVSKSELIKSFNLIFINTAYNVNLWQFNAYFAHLQSPHL